MIAERYRTIFGREDDWDGYWNRAPFLGRVYSPTVFRDIAHYVGGAMLSKGFMLFENGGMPLLERRTGPYREEILFVPAPKMLRRQEVPFAVRIHLSSTAVSRIRSRYWRPPAHAPQIVASGDIGQLLGPDRVLVWNGCEGLDTAKAVIEEITRVALPWFACFANPGRMRDRLLARTLPWIDDCTALELLLSEFDPYEARRYLMRMGSRPSVARPFMEPVGYELTDDRMGPITAYYRL